jgi:hypothetical protein
MVVLLLTNARAARACLMDQECAAVLPELANAPCIRLACVDSQCVALPEDGGTPCAVGTVVLGICDCVGNCMPTAAAAMNTPVLAGIALAVLLAGGLWAN